MTPESHNIEYKLSWRDEYLRWVCAFANSKGGRLVIGRGDGGKVVGVANAGRLLEDIPNKVRDILGIVVAVRLLSEDGADLVEIEVEPYPYPVSYKGEYHVRSGSTKQELKGAALDKFILRKQGLHWDGVPVPGIGIADLDPRAIATFRKLAARSGRLSKELLAETDGVLIEKLQLLQGDHLKRAATLLFFDDPERFTTGACVKVGFFRTDSDLLYHDLIAGNLFDQVEKTVDLVKTKYLHAAISYEGIQRVERYPVADSALREAITNAIAHKDYAAGAPVQISVYPDKLMIWNPGQLPPDWTVERLLAKHPSQPPNPDIANAFFRAGRIESWGRGIDLIREQSRAYGAQAPQFACDATGLWVTFPFSVPVAVPVTVPVTDPVTDPVSPQIRQLLSALARHGALSPGALRAELQLSHRQTFRHNYLDPALAAELIERTDPASPNSPQQKYRLTEKARQLLASEGGE